MQFAIASNDKTLTAHLLLQSVAPYNIQFVMTGKRIFFGVCARDCSMAQEELIDAAAERRSATALTARLERELLLQGKLMEAALQGV